MVPAMGCLCRHNQPARSRFVAVVAALSCTAAALAFANAAGLPAIVLPCGFAQGLPVGVQLVAREGADDLLLALARQFERAHPWQRFPLRGPVDRLQAV